MRPPKGSELIFFIVIPLVFLIMAFVFDVGLQAVQSKRLERLTKQISKDALTTNTHDYYERIKNFYEENNISVELLEVLYTEDGYLYIFNSHSYDAFFGKVIGTGNYRSDISMKSHLNDDEVISQKISRDDFPEI